MSSSSATSNIVNGSSRNAPIGMAPPPAIFPPGHQPPVTNTIVQAFSKQSVANSKSYHSIPGSSAFSSRSVTCRACWSVCYAVRSWFGSSSIAIVDYWKFQWFRPFIWRFGRVYEGLLHWVRGHKIKSTFSITYRCRFFIILWKKAFGDGWLCWSKKSQEEWAPQLLALTIRWLFRWFASPAVGWLDWRREWIRSRGWWIRKEWAAEICQFPC